MMAGMKNESPWIRIRLAYPRVLHASDAQRRLLAPRLVIGVAALVLAALVFAGRLLGHITPGGTPPSVGPQWIIPFGALLIGIALIPGIFPHWWEKFYAWFCLGISIVAALWYLWRFGGSARSELAGSLTTYTDFIVLLGALFIIASGIVVRVGKPATPAFNALVLLLAAILANVFGSMGASVLLARPFFRMNRSHIRPFHVVFFVLIVANVGASLTALGDPPLLLGFLTGVPFWWITIHAWKVWLLAVGLLLGMFYILDRRHRGLLPDRVPIKQELENAPVIEIDGVEQLLLLLVALAALFLAPPWRDAVMVLAAAISLLICPAELRHENRFNFQPIREIGILFLAIFLTMTPVLNLLTNQARAGQLAHWLGTSGKCFFTAGALSSVLDNAPTYMAVLQAKLAENSPGHTVAVPVRKARSVSNNAGTNQGAGTANARALLRQKLTDPDISLAVLAISLGSVFFGGLTWIGNGPNLMIRAIAQQEDIVCPGFVGYIFRYALPVLLPVLILIWLIFFW